MEMVSTGPLVTASPPGAPWPGLELPKKRAAEQKAARWPAADPSLLAETKRTEDFTAETLVIAMDGVQSRVRKETGVRLRVGPRAHSVHSGGSGFVPPLLAEPQPGGGHVRLTWRSWRSVSEGKALH